MLRFSSTLVLLIGLGNARALMLLIRRMMITLQCGRFGHVLMLLLSDKLRGLSRHLLTH